MNQPNLDRRGKSPCTVPLAETTFTKVSNLDMGKPCFHEPGIELFAFHGNVNKPMEGLEGGHMSKDIIKAKNGRWVFEDLRVRLKVGDIIYFWLYVQVDGLGYRRDDQKFTVKELVGEGPQPDPTPVKPVTPEPTLPATCGSTLTTVNGGPTCQGQLIFEDNFDGLDISKWQYDVRIAGSPNNEFVAYTKSPENCYTQNGILRVKPSLLADTKDITKDSLVLDGCTGLPDSAECTKKAIAWDILPPVLSSRLQSKQTFSFCYGKVEVRAKLPAGDWIYPELWLTPKDNWYGRDYTSGQIRLAMSRGNKDIILKEGGADLGSKRLEAGCLLGLGQQVHKEVYEWNRQGAAWCDNFHVYTLVWTPGGLMVSNAFGFGQTDKRASERLGGQTGERVKDMTFSVDGQQFAHISPPNTGFSSLSDFSSVRDNPWLKGSNIAPFDKEFYLSLGLGVGGIGDFPDNCATSLPSGGFHPKPWKNTGAKVYPIARIC
uniref:(California timema) hypothetical protein n=1 Tax=Timema californicum TaxID=61474 RepID=A0A7R9J8S2_TIMCA|nr:unnamed protein product [Timema californicum]